MVGAAGRKLVLVPIMAQLAWRGSILASQPFTDHTVPAHVWLAFLTGAVVLAVLIVAPWTWPDRLYASAAVAAGGPYIAYTAWVVTTFELSGIVVATAGDFLLIPYLIAFAWGKTRKPDDVEVVL